MYHLNLKKTIRLFRAAASAAFLTLALVLLSSCSGTGSMYSPEDFEDASAYGTTAGADAASDGAFPEGVSGDPAAHGGEEALSEEPEEEPPVRRAWLEGTGSDLYTVQTVDSYYQFSLEGVSMQLPCSFSVLSRAGWELLPAGTADSSGEILIPPCSYEYFDAVPAGEAAAFSPAGGSDDGGRRIRLCIGNDTDSPVLPEEGTVFGIIAAEESGVSLKTAFEPGIGSSLSDLTSVFGTDGSVLSQTRFDDGTCTARYQFSHGLTEGERIPVLAEAEEKDLAELMIIQTAGDGSTITALSLYYFRLAQ